MLVARGSLSMMGGVISPFLAEHVERFLHKYVDKHPKIELLKHKCGHGYLQAGGPYQVGTRFFPMDRKGNLTCGLIRRDDLSNSIPSKKSLEKQLKKEVRGAAGEAASMAKSPPEFCS